MKFFGTHSIRRAVVLCCYVYAILWYSPKNGEEKEPRALPLEPAAICAVLCKAQMEIKFLLNLTPDAYKRTRRAVCCLARMNIS